MLENCWKIVEKLFYYDSILLYDPYYAIVGSSGFIAIVGKVGSSGSMAAVAERSLWPQ